MPTPRGHEGRIGFGRSLASVAAHAERRQRLVQLARAASVTAGVLAAGTAGYYVLTDGHYGLLRCMYMTLITVSTVGFEHIIPLESTAIIVLNMALILFGGASLLYFFSASTALVVEGDLIHGLFRRRVERAVKRQRQHVVVVGLGRMGRAACVDLWAGGASLVAVDHDEARVGELIADLGEPPPFVVGDALERDALDAAGIDRAAGLIAAMPDDRDNLYLTVIARGMNPGLRIVSRVDDPAAAAKLEDSGADQVVVPSRLTARRLALDLVDPARAAFLDLAFGASMRKRPVDLVDVAEGAVGQLADRFVHQRIVALREPGQDLYRFCPGMDSPLRPGQRLVALAVGKGFVRHEAAHPVPLSGRVVVAGCGRVGRQVLEDLQSFGLTDVVMVDSDARMLARLDASVRTVVGSALDDDTLRAAGLVGAAAVVAALPSARDNAYLCVSARRLEPSVRVVARVDAEGEAERLARLGADSSAALALLGARRLRDAMVEPELAHLDAVVTQASSDELQRVGAHHAAPLFLRELTVQPKARAVDRSMADLSRSGPASAAVIVAAQLADKKPWVWRPEAGLRLRRGTRVLALGRRAELARLDDWFL